MKTESSEKVYRLQEKFVKLGVFSLLFFVCTGIATAQPVTTHPRLWLTQDDIPRLQSWAVPGNPIYQNGLLVLATQAKASMDAGEVPGGDSGGNGWEEFPTEMYAELFAFMSLVDPNPTARLDYAQRARTLLMYVMNIAALGAANGVPFRDPEFSIADRSRWYGEAWALTVDWIYGSLTASDKATIRTVFTRWINENKNATYTTYNHPEPIDVVNDPVLVSDPARVRWSSNNYYMAHMRNIGLMAMSLDAADDPGGQVIGALLNATGAWLYVVDYNIGNDSAGGLLAEGFEYSPQSLSYAAQFFLALHTAGQDDPGLWGPQVNLNGNPFWGLTIPAYLHSLSPQPSFSSYLGTTVYLPAWYGDGQSYLAPDYINAFGALGLFDYYTGNTTGLNQSRWIQTHMPPGGAGEITNRARNSDSFVSGILYFLLFDPAAPAPPDPRPDQPLNFFAPGLNRILARTSWDPATAVWFTYKLSWNVIDHQMADGNQFEFYRKGEWLTKERTGYDLENGSSPNHNNLTIENDFCNHCNDTCDYRYALWQTGSQWNYVAQGDPVLIAHSFGSGYVYALGDATSLYNSTYENSTDVAHASRSIFWMEPDHIIVYDRAVSMSTGRFKRFWLNLPAEASVTGNLATITTSSGQRLYVTSLLPAGAAITSSPAGQILDCNGDPLGNIANDEPMQYRLKVEAPGDPISIRFLHVLQGADPGASADPATLIQSTSGTPFEGVAVAGTTVLFPVNIADPFAGFTYTVPSSVVCHRITGLAPNSPYDVIFTPSGGSINVTVNQGGSLTADSGGVLTAGTCPWVICPLINIAPASLPNGTVGTIYDSTVSATSGTTPYTYAVTLNSLPAGLNLDSITGVISGVPTIQGNFNFTISATDANGCTGTRNYSMTIYSTGSALCTGNELFCDDFEDGVLASNWLYLGGSWSETGGNLTGMSTRKAVAIAGGAFAGCSNCAVEAFMQTSGGFDNRVWLLGWYRDKGNMVELVMKEESDKWLLKEHSGGVVVQKAKAIRAIDPGVSYNVRVTFDGSVFQVFVDGTPVIRMQRAGADLFGTVGFQAKATTGVFGQISVLTYGF